MTATKQSISERIKQRIKKAKQPYHANDNIAKYILPGELELLQSEVEQKIQAVLDSLIIDTTNDHNTKETAKRIAKMYLRESFSGRYLPEPEVTTFPNFEGLNELMIVGPIKVRSTCSHHFCPIVGELMIGILPNKSSNIIGLSKYARIAHWILQRPQIQEEAVVRLANLISDKTNPDGLAVVIKAEHLCMSWRGVQENNCLMVNSAMRGSFLRNPDLRREFLALIAKN